MGWVLNVSGLAMPTLAPYLLRTHTRTHSILAHRIIPPTSLQTSIHRQPLVTKVHLKAAINLLAWLSPPILYLPPTQTEQPSWCYTYQYVYKCSHCLCARSMCSCKVTAGQNRPRSFIPMWCPHLCYSAWMNVLIQRLNVISSQIRASRYEPMEAGAISYHLLATT